MSELDKNKMEEFFSNSMEHFNESPSDLVWEGISDRLDEEDHKPIFWWRRYPLMVLPILVIGSLTIYYFIGRTETPRTSDHAITEIIQEKETTEPIKQNYEKENDQLSSGQVEHKESNSTNSNQIDTEATKSNTGLSESPATKDQKDLGRNPLPNSNQNPQPAINRTKSNQDNSIIEDQKNNGSLNQNIYSPNSIENQKQNPKDTQSDLNNYSLIQENKQIAKTGKDKAIQLISFPELVGFKELIHKRELGSPAIVIVEDKHTANYRIGISGRFANTFVSDNQMFNGNESYGIRQEYDLNNRLAITNAIHFNIQHYDIEPATNTIEPVIVQRYTSRSFDDSGGVQKIESNSEYFDFSLGLKYGLGRRIFGFSPFINPSFVGQIYMPQTFKFIDSRGGLKVRENKRIVMYLGSANLNFGIEKQLNDHLRFQITMWGEHSFIPIGLQREKITTLGISTSLLFGK